MCPYTNILEDMDTIQIAYVDGICLMMYEHTVYGMSKERHKQEEINENNSIQCLHSIIPVGNKLTSLNINCIWKLVLFLIVRGNRTIYPKNNITSIVNIYLSLGE